jgi:TRAP-type transport system periplasmic protein
MAVFVFALAAALPSGAQQFTLRVHSFVTPQALDQTKYLAPWAEKVGREANGRIKVEVYGGMQLGGKPADLPEQVQDGVVDIVYTAAGFTPGRFPGLEGLELPFVNTGRSATMSPAAMEYAAKHVADTELKGLRVITLIMTPPAIIHSVAKPVRTLDDWKGMKVRVAGRFIGEMAKAYGATPVGIALPGVFEALQRGQVDGMLINWAIFAPYRFQEVTKHHTNTALFQGTLLTVMNQRSYERLPPELRRVIDANSGPELARAIGKIYDDDAQAAIEATRRAGNNVFELAADERERWRTAAKPAYDVWIAEMNKLGRNGAQMFADLDAIRAKYGRE